MLLPIRVSKEGMKLGGGGRKREEKRKEKMKDSRTDSISNLQSRRLFLFSPLSLFSFLFLTPVLIDEQNEHLFHPLYFFPPFQTQTQILFLSLSLSFIPESCKLETMQVTAPLALKECFQTGKEE